MDGPEWHERDREYREKVKAESRPHPPDTPVNRSATRVTLIVAGVLRVALIAAMVVLLTLR